MKIKISEAEWQQTLIELLQLKGYKVCEFRKARLIKGGVDTYRTPFGADGKGFPDLIAVKGQTCLFIECKSEKGKLSLEQKDWIERLKLVTGISQVFRPSNYEWLKDHL